MNFFDFVVDAIEMVLNLLGNVLSSLGYAINLALGSQALLGVIVSYMPEVVGGAIIVALLVLIIKFLVGR